MKKDGQQCSARAGGRAAAAFTLVELVMVVTIIGIVAAIAVPRMSGASQRASANALLATIEAVRGAIDRYYAEHDRYPGYDPSTGTADGGFFVNQLLQYSNAKGEIRATPGLPYLYGPYLRSPFPTNPFNNLKTVHVKNNRSDPSPADGSVGWVAVLSDGSFGISVATAELEEVVVDLSKRPRFQIE